MNNTPQTSNPTLDKAHLHMQMCVQMAYEHETNPPTLDNELDEILDEIYLLEPKAIVRPSQKVLQAKQAIKSLILEERIDELQKVYVSYDDAAASLYAKPVDWEYGTVNDRINQLAAQAKEK